MGVSLVRQRLLFRRFALTTNRTKYLLILGVAGDGADGLPYSTLSYSNGPGFSNGGITNKRPDLRKLNMGKYYFPAPNHSCYLSFFVFAF